MSDAIDTAIERLQAEAAKLGDQADQRKLAGSAYIQAQTTQAMLGTLVAELTTNGGLDRGRFNAALAQRLTTLADELCAPNASPLVLPH